MKHIKKTCFPSQQPAYCQVWFGREWGAFSLIIAQPSFMKKFPVGFCRVKVKMVAISEIVKRWKFIGLIQGNQGQAGFRWNIEDIEEIWPPKPANRLAAIHLKELRNPADWEVISFCMLYFFLFFSSFVLLF